MEDNETRGRKPKDTVVRESKITLKLSEKELERIEKLANFMEIPKTVAARNMVLLGLEETEGMKRVGLLQLAKGVIKTSEWLENIMNLKKQSK